MNRNEKIYLLFIKHRVLSLNELETLTKWKKITLLRAIASMIIKRQIRVITYDGDKYLVINNKPL